MKIALIGTAPASMYIAPYDNSEWNIWGCSPGAYGVARNPKAWFELHRYEPGQSWFSEGYCEFLRTFKGPVYTGSKVNEIPNSVPIDVDNLVGKYGPYFFTSSLAWMMAMAIETILVSRKTMETDEHDAIGLWGVDMAATEEYGQQRQGCQYFAQLAKNTYGIEVGVPPESDLLRPAPLYGVCEWSHGWIKQTSRARELNQRLQMAEQKLIEGEREKLFLQGALDDMQWQQVSWFGGIDNRGQQFTEPPDVPVMTLNKDVEKQQRYIIETTYDVDPGKPGKRRPKIKHEPTR